MKPDMYKAASVVGLRWQGWGVVRSLMLLVLVVVLGWGSGMPGAIAQTTAPETAPSVEMPLPSSVQAEDIASEKVSQFVHAYLRVVNLLEQREGDLQAAETQIESNRLQQEIETEAIAIINAEGLTLQEYMQLLGLANTDPDFGDRVAAQLQESVL